VIKFCMSVDIHDLITCAIFCDDRLRGLHGRGKGSNFPFPIDLRRRPYNTRTTVRVRDHGVVLAIQANNNQLDSSIPVY